MSPLEPRGVKRVILLDSYLPHSRTEVELVGHTGITGLNGTGKTSHIQLWPLFFGAEPGRLVKADSSGQTKSFIDYYLPGDSSYIVFEYDTQAGTQLACFTTSRDNQDLSILLVSGAYDDELFLGPEDEFLPNNELRQRARADGRNTHKCRSIKEYRELVFGDASMRGRRADQRQFSILAGYPESNRVSMANIYPILVSTINNSIDERLLRRLLYDQSVREAQTRGTQDIGRLNIDVDDLERWISNYRGLEELRRRSGNAESVLQTAARYRELGRQEHVLKQAAERRQRNQEAVRAGEQQKVDALEHERGQEESRHEQAKERHENDTGEVHQRREDARRAKEGLNRRRTGFEEKGIHEKLEIASYYDERVRDRDSQQRRLSALKSTSQDLESEFNEHKDGIRREHESRKEELETERNAISEAEDSERQALEERHGQQQEALDEHLKEADEYSASQLATAREILSELATEKRLMVPDPELGDQRDEAQRQADEAQQEYDDADQRARRAKEAHDQALAERENLSGTLSRLRKEYRDSEAEHTAIEERLQREGTLLEYVREQMPDGQGSLAAVLVEGPNLLYRKDLSPALAGDPSESLFGIRIDTAKLASADIDADERERKVEVEQRIKDLSSRIMDTDRRFQQLEKKELPELLKERKEADQAFELARGRRNACREAVKSAQAAVRESLEAKQATMDQRVAEAEENQRQAQARHEEQKREAANQRQQLSQAQRQEREELQSAKKRERDRIDADLKQLRLWRDQQIDELDELLDKRRREQGVDTGEIHKAEQGLDEARRAVTEAENALSEKSAWEDLQAQIKAEMPQLDEALQETRQTLERMNRGWADQEKEHGQTLARIKREIQTSEEAVHSARREMNALTGVLEAPLKVGEGFPDEATVEAKAAIGSDELQGQFRNVRQQLDESYQQLRSAAMEVAGSVKRSQSPMLQDFNEQMLLSASANGESAQEVLAAADSIRMLYGDPEQWDRPFNHFPLGTRGDLLEDSVRAGVANNLEIGGFIGALKALRTSVKRQAAAIEDHYKTFLGYLSSIDEVELQVDFDLNRVDGYRAAARASQALERHERRRDDSGDDRLVPDRDVCDALDELWRYLSNRRHEQRMDLIDALDMTFRVKRDGGREDKQSRRGETLAGAFSTGIGVLVGVVVLVGFLENQRKRFPVTVPWMLDEILKLDPGNTRELLEALKHQHIFLVSTSPDIRHEHDRYFAKRYSLQSKGPKGERLPSPIFVEFRGSQVEDDPFAVLEERGEAAAGAGDADQAAKDLS